MAFKPATVRYYFDADILGVAKTVAALRSDVTYPGDPGNLVHKRIRPHCPIENPRTLDSVWIPEVTSRGWLIVTRDRHIQAHRAEIAAVEEHGARMVTLASEDAKSTWDQLEVIMCQWRRLQLLLEESGPFVYTASRTSLKTVSLA